ncbi:hypothetical protein ACP4OV_024484 [Aristida adscensionis]
MAAGTGTDGVLAAMLFLRGHNCDVRRCDGHGCMGNPVATIVTHLQLNKQKVPHGVRAHVRKNVRILSRNAAASKADGAMLVQRKAERGVGALPLAEAVGADERREDGRARVGSELAKE